uniref:Uncharacterized protein n=1 Tax=Anguilla anguilla TaxID=7936 RepID=A0A0E9RYK7_ANGAN
MMEEDDLVCEYDSTWEETGSDSEGKNSRWNTGYRVRAFLCIFVIILFLNNVFDSHYLYLVAYTV